MASSSSEDEEIIAACCAVIISRRLARTTQPRKRGPHTDSAVDRQKCTSGGAALFSKRRKSALSKVESQEAMETVSKLEFDVEMTCLACVGAVENSLRNVDGIHSISVDFERQQVLVETILPSLEIQQLIEQKSNRKAILKGVGVASSATHLGAAVAALSGPNGVIGVIRFLQVNENICMIDGTIDGLVPAGKYGLQVHQYGDLSGVSESRADLGPLFARSGSLDESNTDDQRPDGEIGVVTADENGRATYRAENHVIKVSDIIGRAAGISEVSNERNPDYRTSISWGIVARSAGLFENPKRICECSGKTVWDEREEAIRAHSKM